MHPFRLRTFSNCQCGIACKSHCILSQEFRSKLHILTTSVSRLWMKKLSLEWRRILVGEYCVREARPVGRSNKMTLRQLLCNRSASGHNSLQTSVTLCCIGCHPPQSLFKCRIYHIKQACNAAHVRCPPMVQSQQGINVSTFVAVHIKVCWVMQ